MNNKDYAPELIGKRLRYSRGEIVEHWCIIVAHRNFNRWDSQFPNVLIALTDDGRALEAWDPIYWEIKELDEEGV